MNAPRSSITVGAYLRWMIATLLLTIGGVGAFNMAIDPLGVFDAPRIAGVNARKPYLDHHRELTRYHAARQTCAKLGIFGNSRAEIGFDPAAPALRSRGLSAFNHAVPGTSIGTSFNQLHWLKAEHCLPNTLLIGVEFFDFLGSTKPATAQTLEPTPAPKRDRLFFAESVFSISGLRDSITTLLLQSKRYPATITEQGFNPLYNYIPEVNQSGHYTLFRQRAEENVRNWTRKAKRIRPRPGVPSDDEAALEAMLRETATDSTTYLIIYPYHAQIRMLIERLGLGDLLADWKRLLVDAAERQAALGKKVEVWDFSAISPETQEAIPLKGDRQTHLTHYWEAGHFKKALGDQLIARLLGAPGNFGTRLNKENIEPWLGEDRERVRALLSAPSPLLNEVDDVLSSLAKN